MIAGTFGRYIGRHCFSAILLAHHNRKAAGGTSGDLTQVKAGGSGKLGPGARPFPSGWRERPLPCGSPTRARALAAGLAGPLRDRRRGRQCDEGYPYPYLPMMALDR